MRAKILAAFAAILVGGVAAASDTAMPDEIHGRYAPGGDCARLPRVAVDGGGVRLETSAGPAGPLPVSVCYSCAGGARYDGVQRWVYVKYGRNQWGDNMPVILMFNAGEQRGALEVEHDATVKTPLGAPMDEVVRAKNLKLCRSAGASAAPAAPANAAPASRAPLAAVPARGTPAQDFGRVIHGLMLEAADPPGTYGDWRDIEAVAQVRWNELPPDMLEQPLEGQFYFRRNGVANVGGQTIKVMAAGARSLVMAHYFKNEERPLGETAVLQGLRDAGLSVAPARCASRPGVAAPTWYRLSGGGKRTAHLWVAPSRGPGQPWEGYSLSLDATLRPMTAAERTVYTDTCR